MHLSVLCKNLHGFCGFRKHDCSAFCHLSLNTALLHELRKFASFVNAMCCQYHVGLCIAIVTNQTFFFVKFSCSGITIYRNHGHSVKVLSGNLLSLLFLLVFYRQWTSAKMSKLAIVVSISYFVYPKNILVPHVFQLIYCVYVTVAELAED